MTRLFSHSSRDDVPRPGLAGLGQPVAAVLGDRIDDVAVAEAAARIALARRAPLLLIAVLPPQAKHCSRGPASAPVRAVLARVMPRVGPLHLGYIPEAFHLPGGGGSRLAAAKGLLALAARHRATDVVAARRGPHGLGAHTLVEAAALRGGPTVHAVAPAWAPLRPSGPAPRPANTPAVRRGSVPR
ncbi:universal stress protein [Streptomyces globosus]|uniref:universal stress protein n=1 Tax=Streptomyces globosus TaxID=68209 RepID=UPI001575E8FE|nr:universal stress protein [Streptomyces globosus]